MNSQPRVVILLSTYNGEAFVGEQLDSLFGQSYPDFTILVRDDGSTDSTAKVLADYSIRYPEKFQVIKDEAANLGAAGSFASLIAYALDHKAELGVDRLYLMLCDQDDFWHADKVTKQMNVMLASEAELQNAGTQSPAVLVHSDLQVVDEELNPIADSLARYQGLETHRNSFANLVISNLVTGCTALFNEDLARKAMPMSSQAIMHDWWLALVASAFGRIVYVDSALISYRQHGANTIGAKEKPAYRMGTLTYWQKVFGLSANPHLEAVARQASAFRDQYHKELSGKQRRLLRLCAALKTRVGILQRVLFRVVRRF